MTRLHDHYADAIADPDHIRVAPGVVCLRFEVMKLRSALGAVRRLVREGRVRHGDTLVDSSSGIYALALALAGHRYGMRCHIVGSTTVDDTIRVQLEILGATLERVPRSNDLMLDQHRRVERIGQLLRDNPGYHWMRQYHDGVHYLGYQDVADELDELVEGPLTLVGGVGTGASTGALTRYLRRKGRDVTLVAVQPFGSTTFDAGHTADPEMIIAGIGSSIPFGNVHHHLYDRVHWVSFGHARAGAVALLRDSGTFAGLSSGAGYLVAGWERTRAPGRTVVFLAPDTGHRYVSTVFAAHTEVPALEHLAPRQVPDTDAVAPPWSVLDWAGRSTRAAEPVIPQQRSAPPGGAAPGEPAVRPAAHRLRAAPTGLGEGG